MRVNLERAMSFAVVVSALGVAGTAIHAEFFGRRPIATSQLPKPPERVKDWSALASAGSLIGNPTAPVKVVEFGDLECPFCKRYHDRFKAIQTSFGDKVALVFVPFPLPMHRFALPAAQAAECADDQGRFSEFLDAAYAQQDSFGLKPWTEFARYAGIRDTDRFKSCLQRRKTFPRIDAGLRLGRDDGIHGTPTIIINGWRFERPPVDSTLTRVIFDLLAGKGLVALASPNRTDIHAHHAFKDFTRATTVLPPLSDYR